MADLFPVYNTSGMRVDTVVVATPDDFVFFTALPGRKLRDFVLFHPNVGTLKDILERINDSQADRRDYIIESLIRHGQMINTAFAEASDADQLRWVRSWIGTKLDPWHLTEWAEQQQSKNVLFGVAFADLPQVLLAGMTQDFMLEMRDYSELMYRKQFGRLAPRREVRETRLQQGEGDYYVEAADYAHGGPFVGQALGGQGVEDRDDLHSGEVRGTVRERGQAADSAGQDPASGQGRGEGLSGGTGRDVRPAAPAEPFFGEA